MNSTKLFNFDYFIQNIKKSKSSIIFASIILPLFTVLCMLLIGSDNSSRVLDFTTLSVFNILFMYVVPVVLSISLFNYVFKKNSCDFVGSMPLSRKTIFVTNTIGGIALIAFIQIVTAILIFLTSIVTSNVIIFGSMIWDIFLYFTISYIFVFTVCNLAMSFSGNMFATIAATMLILFFVPFILFASRVDSAWMSYSYYNELNKSNMNSLVYYDQFNFTAPSYIMDCMVSNVEFEYNIPSMLKMIGLSALYFFIGLKLFNRKKFEMAEESYENDMIHLIVKFLTLAPFFAVGVESRIIENPISFVFFFAIVGVYYFLFDIVTKKKIKTIKSIITFLLSSAVMYTLFALIVPRLDFIVKKTIKIDNIKSVTISSISTDYGNRLLTNLDVSDKNLIYGMLLSDSSSDNHYIDYTSADLIINTDLGKKYSIHRDDIPNIKKIIEKYGSEEYKSNIDNSLLILSGVELTKEDDINLREAIKADLDGITYNDLYQKLKGDREVFMLTATNYTNHKIVSNSFSASEFTNIILTSINIINKTAYKHASDYDFTNMVYMPDFEKYIVMMNPGVDFEEGYRHMTKYQEEAYESGEINTNKESGETLIEEDFYEDNYVMSEVVFEGLSKIEKDVLREYLYEHREDDFDKTKPYYALSFPITDGGFYSNDLKDFYKLFAKAFNDNYSADYGFKLREI